MSNGEAPIKVKGGSLHIELTSGGPWTEAAPGRWVATGVQKPEAKLLHVFFGDESSPDALVRGTRGRVKTKHGDVLMFAYARRDGSEGDVTLTCTLPLTRHDSGTELNNSDEGTEPVAAEELAWRSVTEVPEVDQWEESRGFAMSHT